MTALLLAAYLSLFTAGVVDGQVAGTIPAGFGPPVRIVWIDATAAEPDARCQLQPSLGWRCDGLSSASRGLVVLVGNGALAVLAVGIAGVDRAGAVCSWGRLLRVSPGGVVADDLHDLRVTPWKPARSTARRQAQRFSLVEDPSVHVMPLSNIAFWVSGGEIDQDAFVQLEGPAIASLRIPAKTLMDAPPELPRVLEAVAPFALTGRVVSADGQEVEAADVELFEPLNAADEDGSAGQPRGAKEAAPLVRVGQATSRPDGTFTFDRLATGRYELVASHPSLGRATQRIERFADSLVLKLVPPARAAGRVVRHGLPVAGARVRFVPDPAAWMASTDPMRHLAVETSTGDDGRFSVVLPPERAGLIQIIAPNGASLRLPLAGRAAAGDLVLGDLALPELRRLTVRLLDQAACDLIAVGPIGSLGLSVVHATSAAGTYWFELPEAGTWTLNAQCGQKTYNLDPPVVTILPGGPEQIIEARLK